uniref:Fission, mitochondrial 1 n=1 Tax=Felis catus TaxID=9685 RepID=A0ABI7W8W4_FELCA
TRPRPCPHQGLKGWVVNAIPPRSWRRGDRIEESCPGGVTALGLAVACPVGTPVFGERRAFRVEERWLPGKRLGVQDGWVPGDKAGKKFEKKFQSEKAGGSVSKSTQFEYAWCLVRSKYNDDIRKGIALLEELLPNGSKEEQRDYVFYLAVGNYRLKEYEKALKYVRGLLQTEPQNNQAKELEQLIDKAMKKDGLVGMAIVGGMALGVAGLAGLIGLAVSKSKS